MNHKIKQKYELRNFGLLIGLAIPFFIGLVIPLLMKGEIYKFPIYLGSITILVSIIYPEILYYPEKFWMKFSKILGNLNGKLIFILIYTLILFPIAIVMKIFRYYPLKRINSKDKTYLHFKKSKNQIDLNRIF